LHAHVISQIAKNIFSCKNVVYKGRRKVYLTKFFSSGGSKNDRVPDDMGIQKVTSIDIDEFRMICFDSEQMEIQSKSN